MKALKSHSQIERAHCIRHSIYRAKQKAGLALALASLISVLALPDYCRGEHPSYQVTVTVVNGSWDFTGDLNTPRARHTATLLQNGKVLVVGGRNTDSAELYDHATGTWSSTGSLPLVCELHTATLLANGKVLVVGGFSSSRGFFEFFSSAELYDPATGTWSLTDSLKTGRFGHTATLLKNGKVLVAGGSLSSNGAELYDPITGKWSITGSLITARRSHTATLLENGNVLIAGGENGADFIESAELYDPATEKWSSIAGLNQARLGHTATLLGNGMVLVAGGDGNLVSTSELYNPETGGWSSISNLNMPRYAHTATLLPNGRVLVAGNFDGISSNGSAEIYDPETGTWSRTGSLNTDRHWHTATLLPNGKVLVAGGFDKEIVSDAELYDADAPNPIPEIISVSVSGRRLIVLGENFRRGSIILLNGEEQKTRNADHNPQSRLIGKKAGKKIKPGDKLQVRNPDGSLSEEFAFTGP
ncbi:MAG TPA: kelch repeat-containing protein [Blastocatellia bacterium]|nr:kelch repeat-containing protein [Blastocatellia bacterium]